LGQKFPVREIPPPSANKSDARLAFWKSATPIGVADDTGADVSSAQIAQVLNTLFLRIGARKKPGKTADKHQKFG